METSAWVKGLSGYERDVSPLYTQLSHDLGEYVYHCLPYMPAPFKRIETYVLLKVQQEKRMTYIKEDGWLRSQCRTCELMRRTHTKIGEKRKRERDRHRFFWSRKVPPAALNTSVVVITNEEKKGRQQRSDQEEKEHTSQTPPGRKGDTDCRLYISEHLEYSSDFSQKHRTCPRLLPIERRKIKYRKWSERGKKANQLLKHLAENRK